MKIDVSNENAEPYARSEAMPAPGGGGVCLWHAWP